MDRQFFFEQLYPFQDRVLSVVAGVETEFHLTGGTALSRGYLDHRFSDDLDLFVNDDSRFGLWADRVIHALQLTRDWSFQVVQRDDRYVRLNLELDQLSLKIELANDVPSRVGQPWIHPQLGMVDTAENILANKITVVLDRTAPKDLAGIWALCCPLDLSLEKAITGAQGKAAAVFPVDPARVLCSATQADWDLVRWNRAPDALEYVADLHRLGQELILGVQGVCRARKATRLADPIHVDHARPGATARHVTSRRLKSRRRGQRLKSRLRGRRRPSVPSARGPRFCVHAGGRPAARAPVRRDLGRRRSDPAGALPPGGGRGIVFQTCSSPPHGRTCPGVRSPPDG